MRLIDVDNLKEDLNQKVLGDCRYGEKIKSYMQWVIDRIIDEQPTIEPVKRGEREINADELLKRLDQYFEDNGLEHKWTGDEIADSMSGTVEDIVRIVKEMLGESDDEDEETWW
jgi:hypothetical protein